MARRLKMLFATLVIAGVAAGVAAGAGGSEKFPLLGPFAGQICDGSGFVGDTSQTGGFAVINYDRDTGMVLATVSLKRLDPNTTYNVELIQGADDCLTNDGTITTNGHGNGNVSVTEPSTSSHAFVQVCNGYPVPDCGAATEAYVTDTYYH
jgi:hypothetical protein